MEPRRYGPFSYSPITKRPPLRWPNGAKLAVWVVPNIEFFPLNEAISGEALPMPNIFAWSRRDYGNRVGVFRLMDALAKRNIRATVALNAEICLEHPYIIERAKELRWELMGHCESNARPLHKMTPDDEQRTIRDTLMKIEESSGTAATRMARLRRQRTWKTLDFLADCGVRYVADWINDDQPYPMTIGKPPIVSIPLFGGYQ